MQGDGRHRHIFIWKEEELEDSVQIHVGGYIEVNGQIVRKICTWLAGWVFRQYIVSLEGVTKIY